MNYHIILFKIEGHETWRISVKKDIRDFIKDIDVKTFPIITDTKLYLVDKISGDISLDPLKHVLQSPRKKSKSKK